MSYAKKAGTVCVKDDRPSPLPIIYGSYKATLITCCPLSPATFTIAMPVTSAGSDISLDDVFTLFTSTPSSV